MNAPNDCVVTAIAQNRIFEKEVVDAAGQYIRKGTCVFDVGSNLGQMAILFSEMAGDAGEVFAFEADDYIFTLLQKNIDANHRYNIRPFFRAVFHTPDKEIFFPEQDFKRFGTYGSYGIDLNAKTGRRVKTITIDELEIRTPVSFMKVDIQGSDLFAMQGAVQTIRRHRMPILFEFEEQFQSEFGTSFQDYLNFINSIGYKIEKQILNNYLIVPQDQKNAAVSTEKPISSISGLKLSPQRRLCKFLKNRSEVEEATRFLQQDGYLSNITLCKDWDMAHFIPEIGDGNFLDMGSSLSYILRNINLKKIRGGLYGIDLQKPDMPIPGVEYVVGDLMHTPFADNFFANITCLSVIEHQVDFEKFARETSRILAVGGKLFVTFDYWEPKITPHIKSLYQLKWQPLDRQMALDLIENCKRHNLVLVEDMDWSIGEKVIHKKYYSPDPNIGYTFGMAVFEKK